MNRFIVLFLLTSFSKIGRYVYIHPSICLCDWTKRWLPKNLPKKLKSSKSNQLWVRLLWKCDGSLKMFDFETRMVKHFFYLLLFTCKPVTSCATIIFECWISLVFDVGYATRYSLGTGRYTINKKTDRLKLLSNMRARLCVCWMSYVEQNHSVA